MAKYNWMEALGWNSYQLEELRFSGFSFAREGKYDKALIYFEALTTLDPTNAYDFQTLGAIYLQIHEEKKSLVALDRALELEPTHAPTLLNKVKALVGVGEKNAAFSLAKELEKNENPMIADDATAVMMAHS